MAYPTYVPYDWVNNVTPVDEAKLDHIEQGIKGNNDDIQDLDTRVAGTIAVANGAVPKSLVDAKGDLIGATANDTPAKVTAGADGTVLMADSAQAAGLAYNALQGRQSAVSIGAAGTDIAWGGGRVNRWILVATTGGGTLRRVGGPSQGNGVRLVIRNTSASPITITHNAATGTGQPLLNSPTNTDLTLAANESVEYDYIDGNWYRVGGSSGGASLTYKGDWAAGTYQDGDIVVKDGIVYLCQGGPTAVAPDPAPWGTASPLTVMGELGYGEYTGGVLSITALSEAAAQTVVTAPPITVDGATPIMVEFFSPYVQTPAATTATLFLYLYDGATSLGYLAAINTPASAIMGGPVRAAKRITPAAGTHTYSVKAYVVSGSGAIQGGAGGIGYQVPTYIRIAHAAPFLGNPPAGAVIPVTYGTTLPASPSDGQEAILVDSVTNPSYQWRFRYNAGSSSAYKWEFVGGAPARSYVAASESTSSSTPVDLATVGPQIVVPRSGEYDAEMHGYPIISTGGPGASVMELRDNGAVIGATGFQAVASHSLSGPALQYFTSAAKARIAVVAGHTLKVMYYVGVGGSIAFGERHLFVTPVRVA